MGLTAQCVLALSPDCIKAFVFTTAGTFTVVHHTAPHIPFKPAGEWNAAKAQLSGTVHCDYPRVRAPSAVLYVQVVMAAACIHMGGCSPRAIFELAAPPLTCCRSALVCLRSGWSSCASTSTCTCRTT